MNLPSAIYAMRWLVWDTFRQARAAGIFWLMLVVSAVCILVCLSVGVSGGQVLRHPGERPDFVRQPARDPGESPEAYQQRLEEFRAKAKREGVDVVSGELTLAFGALRVPLGRDGPDAVHFLELILAGFVADAAGILLALVWTGGFLPSFLEAGAASVLLAKPTPRWALLLGKYLGVLVFVAFQAVVFVGGTWLALGARTGVWDPSYLLCIPVLLLHFAVFFSCSALLAVWTRNTIACVFGSLGFWFLCWGMNYARHVVAAAPDLEALPPLLAWTVEVGYWVLPKPADLGMLLANALEAGQSFAQPVAFRVVQERGAFWPDLSVLSSLAFTAVLLAVAAWEFFTTDY
jgi:ABC-2 family transporter